MRTMGAVVVLAALVGCGAKEAGNDAGWVAASDALKAHGVATYRAQATANGQKVALRDGAGVTIGELELDQAEAASTVTLDFRADSWTQVVLAAAGTMTLTLDGRQATLQWEGGAWTGDAQAMALLSASQPYADFVRLVGGEARLGAAVATAAQPADTVGPVGDMGGHPTPPPLCCGLVVTTGSGWAWYWETDAKQLACKRATEALQAACNLSSGHDCCHLPATDCTACVDWGTGYACSTAGYLQYQAPAGGSCQ